MCARPAVLTLAHEIEHRSRDVPQSTVRPGRVASEMSSIARAILRANPALRARPPRPALRGRAGASRRVGRRVSTACSGRGRAPIFDARMAIPETALLFLTLARARHRCLPTSAARLGTRWHPSGHSRGSSSTASSRSSTTASSSPAARAAEPRPLRSLAAAAAAAIGELSEAALRYGQALPSRPAGPRARPAAVLLRAPARVAGARRGGWRRRGIDALLGTPPGGAARSAGRRLEAQAPAPGSGRVLAQLAGAPRAVRCPTPRRLRLQALRQPGRRRASAARSPPLRTRSPARGATAFKVGSRRPMVSAGPTSSSSTSTASTTCRMAQ